MVLGISNVVLSNRAFSLQHVDVFEGSWGVGGIYVPHARDLVLYDWYKMESEQ